MSSSKVPSKEECIAVDLANQLAGTYDNVISRIISWPDSIGFAADRGGPASIALIEFPAGHAVVWLERRDYADLAEADLKETALKVLRQWARL